MVETAPLPAGFDARSIDAATLPPAPATPAMDSSPPPPPEAAAPRMLHAQGYSNISATARANFEAGEALVARLKGRPIQHAAERAALQRQREEEAEAVWRAGPDPRAVLRSALGLRTEAAAEVDRLAAPLARGRQLVEDLERRQQEAVAADDDTAAARLIDALAAGTEAPPVVSGEPAIPEPPAAALRTARLALDRLEAEDRAARDLLERRTHGVGRCALRCLVHEAVELADRIIDQADQLARQRDDLYALSRLLIAENRRLNGTPAALPAPVNRALYSLVKSAFVEGATDWRAVYDRLQREGEGKDPA
jgi:hypothetical protein